MWSGTAGKRPRRPPLALRREQLSDAGQTARAASARLMSFEVLWTCGESRILPTRSPTSTPASSRRRTACSIVSGSSGSMNTSSLALSSRAWAAQLPTGGELVDDLFDERLVVALNVVKAMLEQQRDRTLPSREGGQGGGAEHVERGSSQVAAQFIGRWRVGNLVDLREPIPLLVVQSGHQLGAQPGKSGRVRPAKPLEAAADQGVDAKPVDVGARPYGLRAVEDERDLAVFTTDVDQRGNIRRAAREREHPARADHAGVLAQGVPEPLGLERARGRGMFNQARSSVPKASRSDRTIFVSYHMTGQGDRDASSSKPP